MHPDENSPNNKLERDCRFSFLILFGTVSKIVCFFFNSLCQSYMRMDEKEKKKKKKESNPKAFQVAKIIQTEPRYLQCLTHKFTNHRRQSGGKGGCKT